MFRYVRKILIPYSTRLYMNLRPPTLHIQILSSCLRNNLQKKLSGVNIIIKMVMTSTQTWIQTFTQMPNSLN